MYAFLLIQLTIIITKTKPKNSINFKIKEGFLYLSLNGHGANLSLMVAAMVGGGGLRSWVATKSRQNGRKMALSHSCTKTEQGCSRPLWAFIGWLWWLPTLVEVLGVLGEQMVVVGGQEMAEKSLKNPARDAQQQANRAAADRIRGFECVFQGLASSIKKTHKLGFIVDITSFQLAQKKKFGDILAAQK